MEETTKSLADNEISGLPPWAQVALAARCARRVYPLLLAVRVDRQEMLAKAVREAAQAAGSAGKALTPQAIEAAAAAADKAIVQANEALLAASYAARAAACAIQASLAVVNPGPAKAAPSKYATEAFGAALRAIGAEPLAQVAILRDLKAVRDALQRSKGEAAISQDVFGPLWPEGRPSGWPDTPDL